MKHLLRISTAPVQQYISLTFNSNFSTISSANSLSKLLAPLVSSMSTLVNTLFSKVVALTFYCGALLSKVVQMAGHNSALIQVSKSGLHSADWRAVSIEDSSRVPPLCYRAWSKSPRSANCDCFCWSTIRIWIKANFQLVLIFNL